MTGGRFAAEERDCNPSVKSGWFAMAEALPRTRPPLLAAEEIAALPAMERRRYDQARAAWHANLGPIRTPQVDAVFEALEEICGSNLQDGDKVRPAAVLDALPGLGKTTAALAFGRWFHREQIEMHGPQVKTGDGTWQRIPVAYLGLTSHTTMRSLNAMLAENPPPAHHALLLDQFARIGIGPGLDVDEQPEVVKRGLLRAASVGMPLLRQQVPGIELLLVGSYMPAEVSTLAAKDVVPLGYVPSLDSVFERVRLTIAPLRYGAGLKGKVLESMAAGVPCVMTTVAAEGVNLPAELQSLVADEPATLSERIAWGVPTRERGGMQPLSAKKGGAVSHSIDMRGRDHPKKRTADPGRKLATVGRLSLWKP